MMMAESNSRTSPPSGVTASNGQVRLDSGGISDAVVVGMGVTGLSCARYLAHRGIPFSVADSRSNPPQLSVLLDQLPTVSCTLGRFNPALFTRCSQLIISPGLSLNEPAIAHAVEAGVEVVGDIELFAREATAPVAAITGSNGKSTVTTLLGEMARQQGLDVRVGGNLGTPALDLLSAKEPDLYVLELSSFQLETTRSLNANAATVLNVSPDHMDRYSDIEGYLAAKSRIFRGDGAMVINRDDPLVAAIAETSRPIIGFTLKQPGEGDFGLSERNGAHWLAHGAQPLLPVEVLGIHGWHNVANALAGLAMGHAMGLGIQGMVETLRSFRGLHHRCEPVASEAGITWYNDSKGTNVGATVAAINGLAGSGKLVLIAGGEGKGADFTPLAQIVAAKVSTVVLIGRDADRIEAAISGATPVHRADGIEAAVSKAASLVEAGDVVLLSPACASFDMFENYQARGDAFTAAVQRELER